MHIGKALDNDVLSCANPDLMQRQADHLTAAKIDALLRKRLASPAEFALTLVFFEEVMRENLDLGRPAPQPGSTAPSTRSTPKCSDHGRGQPHRLTCNPAVNISSAQGCQSALRLSGGRR